MPDIVFDRFNQSPLVIIKAEKNLDCSLGMNPAQRMQQHIKLPGIITDDGKIPIPSVMEEAADKSAFGGDSFVMLLPDALLE